MFRFKRFAVAQGGAAMKVGTDGVLLGAWCPMGHSPARVLDIGTGTGLIALMAAQRGEAWGCEVDAVEIDPGAAAQARTNFAASPWAERLEVYNSDIQRFVGIEGLCDGQRSLPPPHAGSEHPVADGSLQNNTRKTYNLVISNPPFFSDSLVPPDERRAMARHTATLSYGDLVQCAAAAMSDDGVFAVVVPFDHAAELTAAAAQHGLYPNRRLDVRPTPERPPHRAMLAFGRHAASPARDTLTIEASRHDYTPEYRELTREFYLKF